MYRRPIFASALVAFCLLPEVSFAQIKITGRVVEGNDANTGIPQVRVEIWNGDQRLATERTKEDGAFEVAVVDKPPLKLIARYRKGAYLANPTNVTFEISSAAQSRIKLSDVRLIPEAVSRTYLSEVVEGVVTVTKSGKSDEALTYFPAIVSLPLQNKTYIFEQVRAKDAGLFTSLAAADRDKAKAVKVEQALKKFDSSLQVTPDFASPGRFILNGAVPSKSANIAVQRELQESALTRVQNDVRIRGASGL